MHNIDPTDIRTSIFTGCSGMISGLFGWLPITSLIDGLEITLVSTLIGFYGNKLLRYLDEKFKNRKK